ncbi:ArnT family glycosyltransferase [Chloroflexota bacterium]
MWSWVGIIALAVLLIVLRWLFPERPMDYTGPRALLDTGFALGLLGITVLLAGGLGQKVLRWLRLEDLTRLEQAVFGLAIGLGILAYGVMALGLVGLLHPWTILLWLVLVALWTWREWREIVSGVPNFFKQQVQSWHRLGPNRSYSCILCKKMRHMAEILFGSGSSGLGRKRKLFLLSGSLILVLALLQALTPPWDYDGLMYHLPASYLFLKGGRIVLLPDIWQANGPFTIEMLYIIGLGFGSDTFSNLMHLTYAALLVLATFTFGQRHLKPVGGWVAAAVLLGIPILSVWATWAYADMAWALYLFLGLYALTFWVKDSQYNWLILAGLVTGLALGSKYLALGGGGILGLWVLWHSRNQGWRATLTHGLMFGGVALFVGSFWYFKNWFLAGNPVYPFVFGGPGWSQERLSILMAFLNSFGTGRSVWDYLLLPWNIYARHLEFAGFLGETEWPGFLFPLALLYPWTRKSGTMAGVAVVTMLWFVIWGLGSHQIRFLLPLFPGLSLLTSRVLLSLTTHYRLQKWRQVFMTGLVGSLVAITLLSSLLLVVDRRPLAVIFGMETKDHFLRRLVNNYSALQFVRTNLDSQARVLIMWDGRGYYCGERCLSDTEQSRWVYLISPTPDVSSVVAKLQNMGVTHLLFNMDQADFVIKKDRTGRHRYALDFFLRDFRRSCTREIYRDEAVHLFELTCP